LVHKSQNISPKTKTLREKNNKEKEKNGGYVCMDEEVMQVIPYLSKKLRAT